MPLLCAMASEAEPISAPHHKAWISLRDQRVTPLDCTALMIEPAVALAAWVVMDRLPLRFCLLSQVPIAQVSPGTANLRRPCNSKKQVTRFGRPTASLLATQQPICKMHTCMQGPNDGPMAHPSATRCLAVGIDGQESVSLRWAACWKAPCRCVCRPCRSPQNANPPTPPCRWSLASALTTA